MVWAVAAGTNVPGSPSEVAVEVVDFGLKPVDSSACPMGRLAYGHGMTGHERGAGPLRSRDQIEDVMRRIGMSDRIPEARRVLPEVVDLDKDSDLLLRLGLSLDRIVDEMGGGPW